MLNLLRCCIIAIAFMANAGETWGCSHTLPLAPSEVEAIATWSAQRMGLQTRKALPCLRTASALELTDYRYKNSTPETAAINLVAIYDPKDNVILVIQDQNINSTSGLSVVVHEMVHYLQFQSGERFLCIEQMEEQALTIQEAFLVERGTSLKREFGIDPFSRLVAGLCQR